MLFHSSYKFVQNIYNDESKDLHFSVIIWFLKKFLAFIYFCIKYRKTLLRVLQNNLNGRLHLFFKLKIFKIVRN